MEKIGLALFCAMGTPAVANDELACANNIRPVNACWELRGRVSYFNGNPTVRIWPVGSKHILGVRDSEPRLIPQELSSLLSWETDVFGDLRVCPLTRRQPGKMQIVCVASAKNLTSRQK